MVGSHCVNKTRGCCIHSLTLSHTPTYSVACGLPACIEQDLKCYHMQQRTGDEWYETVSMKHWKKKTKWKWTIINQDNLSQSPPTQLANTPSLLLSSLPLSLFLFHSSLSHSLISLPPSLPPSPLPSNRLSPSVDYQIISSDRLTEIFRGGDVGEPQERQVLSHVQ